MEIPTVSVATMSSSLYAENSCGLRRSGTFGCFDCNLYMFCQFDRRSRPQKASKNYNRLWRTSDVSQDVPLLESDILPYQSAVKATDKLLFGKVHRRLTVIREVH